MKKLSLLALSLLLASCGGSHKLASDATVFWVNSLKVDCEGVGPMRCMQVQRGETPDPDSWENFHGTIQGFLYEEGYIYKLLVTETRLDPAVIPADAPGISYTLTSVLEKTFDPATRLNDIWVATSVAGEVVKDPALAPTLELVLGTRSYAGSDGCNRYRGGIVSWDGEHLKLSIAAGTRMACAEMRLADLYNSTLHKVDRYRISDGELRLFNLAGEEILVFKKTD